MRCLVVCGLALMTTIVPIRASAQGDSFPASKGSYLGQKPPGLTPEVFLPRIVSTSPDWEHSLTCSADGCEIYFTRAGRERNQVMYARLENNAWSTPVETEFSRGFDSMEPHLTPNGQQLYFYSERPRSNRQPGEGIWYVNRSTSGGWGEPRYFEGSSVSVARTGNQYFFDNQRNRLCVRHWINGGYESAQPLEFGVNARPMDHPVIAPDESYILFDSGHDGGTGSTGIWVCFRKADSSWTEARSLGDPVNTATDNWTPSVSPDGRYIFYSTKGDIYWVSSEILEPLRMEALGGAGRK